MSDDTRPDTIVLVHGFWVTPRSWEGWVDHYEKKGYTVLAPAYPGFEVEVEALNADPTPIETRDDPGDRRAPRADHRRARPAADPHGALRGRSVRPDPPRPRLRRRRRGAQLRADRGREGGAAVPAQVDLPGAQEPGQPPPCRRARLRAVALRVHQHVPRGRGRVGSTSATTSPRPGNILWGGALANLHPRPPRRWVDYHNEARAPLLFISGSDDHLMPPKVQRVQRQALQVQDHRHRIKEFDGPATCSRLRRAGSRSPTSPSTGPSGTRCPGPTHDRPGAHPHRRADLADRVRRVAPAHRSDLRPTRTQVRLRLGDVVDEAQRPGVPTRRSSARSTPYF